MKVCDSLIFETSRLMLRQFTRRDSLSIKSILQDPKVMQVYNGVFTNSECRYWIRQQYRRYKKDGFGLLSVVLKETGVVIGQCGLMRQTWKGDSIVCVGYFFHSDYWHLGYATESVLACKRYAFGVLSESFLYAVIPVDNSASQGVARRCGMQIVDTDSKLYRGVWKQVNLHRVSC